MNKAVEPDHRCGLCKKTFKQKSSLVRHAKRCTLEPAPSVRQKACRNCIAAKARCDLQRPECSRCGSRSIPCAYARPPRTIGSKECPPTPNSVPNADPGPASACGLVDPRLDFDTQAAASASTDPDISSFLGCGTDFTGLPGTGLAIDSCLAPDLFTSCSGDTSDATPSSEAGFHAVYSTSCSSTSAHTARHTHSHHSAGSCTESLEAQLDLNSNSPEADLSLPVVLRNLVDERPVPEDSGSTTTTAATPGVEETDPWLMALATRPGIPDPPALVEHSMHTLFRAFRSWPAMLAKGIQLPPIIHPFQYSDGGHADGEMRTPKLIARCVTLCKMWVGQAEDSSQIVESAVLGEAESLLAKYHTYDAPTLLTAMQSLMILLVLLIFPSNRQSTLSSVPGHIFAAIKELANYALSTGMLLHEEASHVRPHWRIWAHIEAKRRTVMCIYFLHWANSVYHGSPHFNCLRLGRMLATSPKWLWQAPDEKTWMNLYGRWLAQWDGNELIQAEFFLIKKGPVMDPRVEMWLEDADELGILIMTIMNASQRDHSAFPNTEGYIIL